MVLQKLHRAILPHVPTLQGPRTILHGLVPERPEIGRVGEVLFPKALKVPILDTITHPLLGGEDEPLVVRRLKMDVIESLEGQIDKDKPYGDGEYFFCESCEETSDGTGIEPHQYKHEYSRPESNPESELKEWNALSVAEVEDKLFKDEGWACGTEDYQGLPREDGVDEIANADC